MSERDIARHRVVVGWRRPEGSRPWACVVNAATVMVLLMLPVPASAQSAPEPVLKAAFLLHFARFTSWPPGSPGDAAAPEPMALCVADDPVAHALEATIVGQRVANRDLVVRAVTPADVLRDCALVYIGRAHARRAPQILQRLEGRSVLTVSDSDRFIADGGMIQLYRSDGHIRFEVGLAAANRASLRLSFQLLQLARPHGR